jgi:hypothetical protein
VSFVLAHLDGVAELLDEPNRPSPPDFMGLSVALCLREWAMRRGSSERAAPGDVALRRAA